MQFSDKNLVSITEANQNFSKVARLVDETGAANISTGGLYRMLRNEKYQGNLLLQKRFRDNHITNHKFENGCATPTLDVDTIKKLFIKAYNTLMRDSAQVISDCELMRSSLADFAELDREIASLQREAEEIAALARASVRDSAAAQQHDSYDRLSRRYDEIQARLKELQTERERRSRKDRIISQFIQTLKTTPVFLDAWDETIWAAMVERAVVRRDGSITFIFYNGAEIKSSNA